MLVGLLSLHIKDKYSWNDETKVEFVYSESVTSKPSPKIYNLRTPLKKSRKDDMVSDIDDTKDAVYKLGKKATTSSQLASKSVSEHSLVDLILLEESSRSKYSKTGES